MSWGIVAGAAVGLIGGAMQSDGARSAANQQADASREAQARLDAQFAQTREDYKPYRETGYRALSQLEQEINKPVSAADVMSDPGYQFALDQGQMGLDRKFAAMGGRVSGAALKAASRFNTGQASSGYNAAYQRRQDRLNRLAALAGIGQTATGSSAAAGANATNAISGLIERQGDANGASTLAQGNIWANTGNQIAALYGRKTAGGSGGSTWGSPGMDNFFYGNGTSGD